MKRILFLMTVLAGIVMVSCQREEFDAAESEEVANVQREIIEGKYIVLFEDTGILKSASVGGVVDRGEVLLTMQNIFTEKGIRTSQPRYVYSSAVRGVAVELTSEQARELALTDGVKGVYPDMMITLKLPQITAKPAPAPVAQSTPWGTVRVGGLTTYSGTAKAWIIDTGIDLDHTDLNVAATSGYNFVSNTVAADDDNGHGTHCAGIAAAKNNAYGVIGVAPGATVVPVKVLNRRGSGTYSAILAGVDFVNKNAQQGDVANLSLGGSAYEPLDLAVIALGAKGIHVSLAAGNESTDAATKSPARANGTNVYTISAMAQGDKWASFSNYGTPVDYCAPGVSIYSTYKGGGYATLSGTSMAAPHVTGLLLIGTLKTDGYVTGDPDGKPDPIAHR